MSPETLLRLCRECYAGGGMTIEQLKQNVEDALAGRTMSAGTRTLRTLVWCALHAQVRYVTPEQVANIVEVAA